jgi:hypothetical protein
MVDWSNMRVMKDPVYVRGRFICRVVGDFSKSPGSGMWVEGWTGSEWTADAVDMPSMNEVFGSPPAPPEVLAQAGVPADPWPEGYEPHEFNPDMFGDDSA